MTIISFFFKLKLKEKPEPRDKIVPSDKTTADTGDSQTTAHLFPLVIVFMSLFVNICVFISEVDS